MTFSMPATTVAPPDLLVEAPVMTADTAMAPRRRRRARGQILFWLSVSWMVLLVGSAVFADWIPGLPGYAERIGTLATKPDLSVGGLLGTDGVGRSSLARVIYGARISLTVAVCSSVIGLAIGLVLGMLAGYYRGAADAGSTIVANTLSSLPPLLLLLALIAAIGASLRGITIALGIVISEFYIRVVKGAVVANANREYVLAAKALGAGDVRVMVREILPNLTPILAAVIPMAMAIMIVVEGSLSFLGYGIPPPNPSWGGMIAAGSDLVRDYPHVLLGPVLALILTVFSLNTIGDHFSRHGDVREAQL